MSTTSNNIIAQETNALAPANNTIASAAQNAASLSPIDDSRPAIETSFVDAKEQAHAATSTSEKKEEKTKTKKHRKEELEAEIAAIEDTLKCAMGEQEELFCGEYKLTYQTVSASRFDSTRFKKEHADLATAYTRTTTYRRFSVR